MSTLTSQNSNPASRIDIDSKLGIEPQLPELKLKKYAPISNSNSTFQLFSTPKSFVNSSTPLENVDFKLTGNNNNNTNMTNITNNNGNSLTSHVPSAPSSISSAGSSNLSYKKRSRGSDNSFQQRDSSVESAHNPLKNGDNRTHSSLTSLKQRIKQHNLNEQQQQQQQQQPDELKNSNSNIDKIPSHNIHKQKSHSLIEERKLNKQRKLIEKQRKQKSLDLSTLLKPKQSQNNNNSNINNNNNNNNNNSPKSLNKNNEDDPGIGLLQETQEATSTLLNARKKLMNDLNIDSIVYQQRVNAICDTKTCDNLDLVDAHDNSSALLNTDQVDLSNSYHGFDDSMADESGDFMSLHHSTSIKKIDSSSTNETPSRVSSSMLKSGTSSNRFNDSNITTNSRTDSMGMAHSNSFMVNLGSSLQNEAHRYDSITSRFLHNQNNKDSTTTESPDTAAQYKKLKISHSTRDRAERVDNFIRKYYSSLDKYINSGRIQNGEKEFKHPGVEGVFNPLQIIRNRRVRRKHKERFKDSILTDIPLPSQVFSKYDEQRLIWQINLQEYLDDISWREFHWNELKDHNNKLWFPKSSDKKKSHIHRHSDHQKHQHRDKYKAYIKDKLYGDNNEKEYRMHEQLFAYNKSNPMSPNSSSNSNNNNNNNGTAPNISMNDSNNFTNNEFDNNNNIKLPSISISHLNRHNVDDNEDLADDDEYLDTMYNNYNYELDGANIIDDNNTNNLNALQDNNGSFASSKFSSVVTPGSAANSSKTDQQQQKQEGTHSNLHSKFKKLSKSPVRLLAGMKSKDDVRLRSSSIATSSPEETMMSEIPSLLGPDNAKSKMAFDNNERGRTSNDLKIPSIIINKTDSRDESILENIDGHHRSSNAEAMAEINNLENGYYDYTSYSVTPNVNDYSDDEKIDDDVIHYMHNREPSTDFEKKSSSILNTHFKKLNEPRGFNESTVSLASNMTDYLHYPDSNSNSNSNSNSFQNSKLRDHSYDDVSDEDEDDAEYDDEDDEEHEDGDIFDHDTHSQSSVLGIYDHGESKDISEQESQRQVKLLKSLLGQVVVSEIHLMALTKKRFSIIKNHEDKMTKSHDEFNSKIETNGDLQRKALKLINEVEEKIEDSNTISNREANKVDELLGYCDRTIGDINTSIALQVRNLNEKLERLSSNDKLTATEDDITKWFYVFVENFIVLLLWVVWIIVEFWRVFRLFFTVIVAILRWIFL